MTTHRASKPVAAEARPAGRRGVAMGLSLAVLAALGWTIGMIHTLARWAL